MNIEYIATDPFQKARSIREMGYTCYWKRQPANGHYSARAVVRERGLASASEKETIHTVNAIRRAAVTLSQV